jgi:hypothetical protein
MAAADAEVLAVLGTGVQARVHVEALRLVRDFHEVRVWGRSPEKAVRLAAEVGAVAAAASAEEEAAVRGAGRGRDRDLIHGAGAVWRLACAKGARERRRLAWAERAGAGR